MTFLDGRINNYQDETRFVIVTDVTDEPVTVAEIKSRLRIDGGYDDTLLASYGIAARRLIEAYTGCRMMPRTEKLLLDRFPPVKQLLIPAAPISAITAITYFDQDDNPTVFASSMYVTDTRGPIGMVALKYGVIWPILGSLRRPVNAVEVSFASGYTDADCVPDELKHAVALLAGHFYENREETTMLKVEQIPLGIRHVVKPHRVWERMT